MEDAVSWHWALVGMPLPADRFGPEDYEIIGSINKGVATELLSSYQHRHMRIYRPQYVKPDYYLDPFSVKKRCAFYGDYLYNTLGVSEAAVAYFLRYIGIKMMLSKNHQFYCLQFYNRFLADFGFVHYDLDYPVTPYDMEHLKGLECIWGTY